MEGSSGSFKARKIVQEVVQRFGATGQKIDVTMRQCEDVPRYIEKVKHAHEQTAVSTLRFGPAATQPRQET